MSALIGLLIASLSTSLTATRQLSEADVAVSIKQALASATPRPNLAIAAYEGIKQSVVLVKTRSAAEPELRARGSGVLLDAGETILTSLHVVRDAVEITVVFFDGQEVPAALGEAAPDYDIAVLDAAGIGQKPAVFAGTKHLKVGDEAFVVGSPLGLSNSLSVGVISKLESTFQPSWQTKPLTGLIQFSAAVYPGNSGGALVNRRGEVIAIVTAVADPVGVSGIGFAVPIEGAASAAGSNPF